MGSAKVNLQGQSYIGQKLKGYLTQDGVRTWGGGNLVKNCNIEDTKGSDAAHQDNIQSIPTGNEPNAQMHGAISVGNVYEGNTLTSNGMSQTLFMSDGAEKDVIIAGNVCNTRSSHEISMCVLSGVIRDNVNANNQPARVVIDKLRVGGGHKDSFYVRSFSGDTRYETLDTNQPIHDLRDKINPQDVYVDDFDLARWRRICERIPYPHNGFNIHFEACIKEYLHGMTSASLDEYDSPTMWIDKNTLFVPDRRKLTEYDMQYWQSRWPSFQPYEVDSQNFSIRLYLPAFDALQALRIADGNPRRVNSAWRTPKHNARIGGKVNSDHTAVPNREINGSAFDLHIRSAAEGRKLEALAIKLGFNAIGRYRKSMFIHISMRKPKPSGAIYQWGYW